MSRAAKLTLGIGAFALVVVSGCLSATPLDEAAEQAFVVSADMDPVHLPLPDEGQGLPTEEPVPAETWPGVGQAAPTAC